MSSRAMESAIRVAALACVASVLAACSGSVSGKMAGDASVADAGKHKKQRVTDAGRDAGAAIAGDASTSMTADAQLSRVCSVDGLCWELPTPQGETLRAIWAAADDDVWAVGDGGVVLHYGGSASGFRAEHVGTHQDLLAVHGSAADDVWAVGKGGDVLHYDGQAWSVSPLGGLIDASGGAMHGVLNGVFAAAKDAVWAVGYSGVSAVIVRYDGTRWSQPPLGLQSDKPLRAVWGVSREQLWAVGDGGVIWSFDGTQWRADKSPTNMALSSVHALAAHDVWAVGANGSAVHWNGSAWSGAGMGLAGTLLSVRVDIANEPPLLDAGMKMPAPKPMPADAGADAGPPKAPDGPWSVWAFGDKGSVYRYNGSVWAPLPSGSALSLNGAARLGEGSLIAVGERGQITRFEGDTRQSLTLGARSNHLGLWGAGETVWSVGDDIMRRDATGWSEMMRPTERSLYSVWGDAGGLWAVGTAGSVVRFKDGQWKAVTVTAAGESWLHGVWGAGSSVWIVGDGGLALVSAAGSFIKVATPAKSNLLDVWGSADDAFWAVGDAGTVLRWDGMAWLKVPTGPMGGVVQNLRAVWGSADDDVWVVGTEGTILHWDGQRFAQQSQPASYSLNDVWGRAKDDVYAVGSGGVALHFDGAEWTTLETGTLSSLQSVRGDDQGHVFFAGMDGVMLVLEQQ